jgi:prepilin-type N-terminal cleavage/methylation domain-containing protein
MRRGYSLIELVVVMTIATVIVGLAAAMLHLLLQTERNGRQQMHCSAALSRLADQFRSDVHAAARQLPATPFAAQGRATGDADPAGWTFELEAGRNVQYRAQAGQIERVETLGGQIERRESYALPPDATVAIATPEDAKPPVATLIVKDTSNREIRIAAVLGKDHRFDRLENE